LEHLRYVLKFLRWRIERFKKFILETSIKLLSSNSRRRNKSLLHHSSMKFFPSLCLILAMSEIFVIVYHCNDVKCFACQVFPDVDHQIVDFLKID